LTVAAAVRGKQGGKRGGVPSGPERPASARVAALLVALGLGLCGVAGCGEEPPAEEPLRPVLSVRVGDPEDISGRRFVGQARAAQEVDAAFEVAGRLIERPVDVGSQVRTGDLLARLDPRDFEADLAAARANEAKSRADFARAVALFEGEVISEAELEAARRRLEVVEAELRKAEKANEETRLVASFDGEVAATYVENFQNVRAKEPVIRLIDTSRIEMVIDLPAGVIGSVPYVKWAKVRFDIFPDHEIEAEIREVGSEASATTRTYPVTLILTPPDGVDIKPGMSGVAWAEVEFPDDIASAGVEVPISALFSRHDAEPDRSFVWVIDEDSLTVSAREVESIDASARGVRVRGLEERERIAVAGVHSLREGMKVRLLE
jgi:RND family efflux transporter MFP subunit